MVGAVVVDGAGPSAAADEPPSVEVVPVAVGKAGCESPSFGAGDAFGAAVQCSRDVEILSERTETRTVYAQPDGLTRLDASAVAVRTEVSGAWAAVDPTLVRAGGVVEVASPVMAMEFSGGGGGEPLARVARDGSWLTVEAPFDLPAPQITAPTQLTYFEVLPGVDLVVTISADASGFTQALRIEDPQAAADPRLAELEFAVGSSGVVRSVGPSGGFEVVDDGQVAFTSPPPLMWDSSLPSVRLDADVLAQLVSENPGAVDGEGHDPRAQAPRGGEQVVTMVESVDVGQVTVVPDAGLLTGADTTWPVYVDPGVTAALADWTTVYSTGGKDYQYTGDDGMGYCNNTSMGCSTIFKSRMMWEYGGLGTIGALTRAQVLSATFSAFGTHSYSCTAYPVSAWRVGGFTANTGWSGMVWYGSALDTQTVAHKAACSNQRRIEWDVTEALRQIADENRNAVAIGLRDPNETTMAGWKRYRNDAMLSVTYGNFPNLPTEATTTNPSLACSSVASPIRSTTPTLSAKLTDPDGGTQVQAKFWVYTATGVLVWNPAKTASQVEGGTFTQTVPAGLLVDGTVYEWRVQATDATGLTGPMLACRFSVDMTAPAPPIVTSTTFPVGAPGGGIGTAGTFALSDSSSDVDHYEYVLDKGGYGTVSGASGTLTWTPSSAGRDVLHVTAVDKAGWTSTVDYPFWVAFAGVTGAWLLDDGQGTSAQDVSGAGAGHPLTLGGGVTWVDGPLGQRTGLPRDWALRFAGGAAATAADVLPVQGDFTVMATVKLEQAVGVATAVSQDSVQVSGFQLGYRQGSACPDGGGCWTFSRPTADTAGAPEVVASVPGAATGEWVQLTGVYDQSADGSTGRLRLYACQVAPSAATVAQSPVASAWASPASGSFIFNADARLVLGRGRAAGVAANPWGGSVADVRVYSGVVDQAMVRAACQSPR